MSQETRIAKTGNFAWENKVGPKVKFKEDPNGKVKIFNQNHNGGYVCGIDPYKDDLSERDIIVTPKP